MSITLVVPVFNAEHSLPALFDSICLQKRMPDQIILVDNLSLDKSLEILTEFQSMHPEIDVVVIRESIRGPGAARNRALEACTGDIIAFTDADCVLNSRWTEGIGTIFDHNKRIDVVGGVEIAVAPRSLVAKYSAFVLACRRQELLSKITSKQDWFNGQLISTLSMAVRREVVQKLRGFENWSAGEDMDFWMRALDHGFRILAHHPDLSVRHRQRVSFRDFVEQQFRFALAVPRLVKRHFRGSTVLTSSRKHLYTTRFTTCLLEVNPHTVTLGLLFLVGWRALLLYALFLITKPFRLLAVSRKVKVDLTFRDCVVMTVITEVLRWVISLASVIGLFRDRILCLR